MLESCDALADTLAAAQRALETMASQSLSFSAQVRVHRQSTRKARQWLRDNLDPEVAARVPVFAIRDEETDEVLRRATDDTEVPLDVGPEDDGSALMTDDTDFTGEVIGDELVSFGEDGIAIDEDGEDLVFEIGDGDVADLVSFDDPGDGDFTTLDDGIVELDEDGVELVAEDVELISIDGGEELVSIDGGDELVSIDADDGLVAIDGDDELVSMDGSDLVNISGGGEDLVTLGGADGDLVSFGDDGGGDTLDHVSHSAEPAEDATLVTDLESLVKLQDLLTEDESSGAAHTADRNASPRSPDPRATDPRRVATTLTEEDLGRLGFTSSDEMLSPEGSDADPSSETGSRPAIRVGSTPEPSDRDVDNAAAASAAGSYTPPGVASIPTIRDTADTGETRATAAIRIGADGVGSVVDEMEPLALGEADEDDLDDEPSQGGGFSIGVEEYEYVDDEPEELPEPKPPEPEPEPAPLPELSDDQAAVLLRQAQSSASRGDLQSAAQLYSDVLDFDPDNADAALGRGRVYLDLGDYARAMSDFTVAEEVRPDDAETNAAIGELYYARKDYTRAIEYFDQALEQNDKHAMAWCRRGIAHYYRKDYAKAYDDLVQAQKLDDSIPNIRTYIGMVKKKRK